ncbi:leucine-rich repeat neuronal protein 4 [Electrophorus electricus]|uniref:Fibronectin type-III domain-containing protein n=1 Tax=Electrophorus electricus TaxID=8005 RepID=A0AAY5ERQ2_ELEEL|nr:leucine-rich repeat neuronal protein 4 [Electrophorus electricus]
MSLLFRNPLTFPLVLSIVILVFTSAVTSPSPRTATLRPGGLPFPLHEKLQDVDYENLSEEPVSLPAPTPNPSAPHCDYNSCRDQQEPCLLMAATQGCVCPGSTGPLERPEPPHLFRLWREGPGSVLVHWCAPASNVTSYHVRVEGQEGQREVGVMSRVMDLGEVQEGAEVCVQAVNFAGVSEPTSYSCTRYEPHSSESTLALKLGVICGVAVLVVVLALALVLWRLRTHRNSRARVETW